MLKAVIYTRVSTEEQKKFGFSLQDQEKRLRDFCKHQNIEIIEHYQEDHSAKDFNRPAFKQFLADVENKKIFPNLFLCIRSDRFSRNFTESFRYINKLSKWGIKVQLLENHVDLDTPESLIPFALNYILPEVENARRAENTKRGLRQGLREGRWMGIAPYGYKNNTVTKLIEIDEEESKVVQFIFDKYSTGIYSSEDVRRMAFEKGCTLTKQAFLNLLNNYFYTGRIKIKSWKNEEEQIVPALHEPLISEETFFKVQQVLSGKRKPYKYCSSNGELILKGLIVCSKCGRLLTGSRSKGNGGFYSYYHCQRKYGCKCSIKASLANHQLSIYLKELQPQKEIVSLYHQILEDVFNKNEVEQETERKFLENQIEAMNGRLNSLTEKFLDGYIDPGTYKIYKERLGNEVNELTAKHISIIRMPSQFRSYLKFGLTLVGNVSTYYENCSSEIKRKMIGSIFPEKLRFENNSYRTSELNDVFALICRPEAGFKKKQPYKNVGLSSDAPAAGLEPATL